ncbi:MAG: hypothetical protein R3A52_22095 [Polyangiales bacterium]
MLLTSLFVVGCGADLAALDGDAGALPISGEDVVDVDAGRDAGAFPSTVGRSTRARTFR